MLHSFKYRFIVSFVLLELIFLVIIAYINFNNFNTSYKQFIQYKEQSLETMGKQLLVIPVSIFDTATIDNIVENTTKLENVVAMKVWDSNNNLLSQSTKDLEEINNPIRIDSDLQIEGINIGRFSIWVDLKEYEVIAEINKEHTILAIIIEILISTIIAWFVGHRISRNLNSLKDYAQNLSKNIHNKIPFLKGEQEVEVLSHTLEEVREQLLIDRYELDHYKEIIDENVIISRTDLSGMIVYVSQAFCEISGYKEIELLGKNHNIVRHPDMPADLYKDLWITIKKDLIWSGEIKNKKKDGTYYWVQTTIYPWINHHNEKIGYIGIRQDITNKKLIEEISITDGLTAIYNRRRFDELFPKIINSAKRENELVSFVLMDIDHFKQYNDTYGHQMGDNVLMKVANALKSSLQRADDYCFRLGGEEFGVIFKVDSLEKAQEFANRIKENIEKLHINHSSNSASNFVTVSMGLISKKACDITNEDEFYKDADDLLYKAKANGRNQVCYE